MNLFVQPKFNRSSVSWNGCLVGCWVRCKKMAQGKSIDNITNTFFVFDHTPSWNESKCKFIYDIHQVCHSFGIHFASFQAHSGFAYHTSLTWNAIKVKRKTLSDKCHFSRILFVVKILQIYNMTASFLFMQDYREKKFSSSESKERRKKEWNSRYYLNNRSNSMPFAISEFKEIYIFFFCWIEIKSFGFTLLFLAWNTRPNRIRITFSFM